MELVFGRIGVIGANGVGTAVLGLAMSFHSLIPSMGTNGAGRGAISSSNGCPERILPEKTAA
jgi:hypothetical protein